MMKHLLTFSFILFTTFTFAQESPSYWPKQIDLGEYVITIYAPEPEKFENNMLDARAAFSLYEQGSLPIFGAMWFHCSVHTDITHNEVQFEDVKLVNANFPDTKAENIEKAQDIIAEAAPGWTFNSNLNTFYKNLESLDIKNASSEDLLNNPPKIYYFNVPAFLIYIDGEPILETAQSSQLYQYVVNTPHFIVYSLSDKKYYLKISDWWYFSMDPTTAWKPIDTPPGAVLRLADAASRTNPETESVSPTRPKLIVADGPSELIQTLGEREIAQAYETLFTISNSDDEIIYEAGSDKHYIIISGRWFSTTRLESGRWTFVPPDELPAIFLEVPPSSSLGHIRTSVAGTPEAMSAALNNTIPQTAVIDLHSATMEVEYDGEPIFAPIDGTSLQYAINTPGSVIMDKDSNYYAVDQAIWFTSDNPSGPWEVAIDFPVEVRNIPPSCPLFNIKYVSIYYSDDDVVFTGYTPGYMGTFLYQGVIYYGTGYHYKSWYGSKYYPTPTTYGSGVKKKNAVSVTVSVGYGYGLPGYGYGWGYPGYGYGYSETVTFNNANTTEKPLDLVNIYKNRKTGIINTETASRNDPMKPVLLKDAPNDMYADKDGKLYKQDDQGNWQENKGNEWVESKVNIRR